MPKENNLTLIVKNVDIEFLRSQRNTLLDIVGEYEIDINSKQEHQDALDLVINLLDVMIDKADEVR